MGYPGQQMAPYDPYAQAAQQPAFQPAGGTLDEYLGQRPAGAAYWKWPQVGSVCIGMVERDLRDTDVQQVTFQGRPVQRRDGSISNEKSLNIPLVNTDGSKAIWEVKGPDRTALAEAVRAQGGPANGLPEGGSMLRVTHTHTEPSRGGGSPRKAKRIEYVPKDQVQGDAPAAAPAQQPASQQAPPQQDLQYASPVPGAQQYQQPAMQAPPAQQYQDPNAYIAPNPGQLPPPVQQYQHATPQQAAPTQQPAAPPAAAGYPQGPPASAPSPTPQPYQAPGMDPQAAALFGNLMGGAPQQPAQ